jgi:DNA-binding PadR family transcriptional regulator
MANRESKADVLQGTLDLMVLQTLDTMGRQHGYAIAARLEQVSARARLQHGHALSRLMRLEQRGCRAQLGDDARPIAARFYALTAAGRRELAKKQARDRMTTITGAAAGEA